MSTKSVAKGTARERLLAAANELFYSEGVQSVGIDRIIEQAGVAKASLYNTYGSKEELVRAYLGSRREGTAERIGRVLDRYDTPRAKLLGIFEAQAELVAAPEFRGCAFVSATAEARPGGVVERAADEYRNWWRQLFTDLARDAGAHRPETLAWQLQMLYDGASLSGRLDRDASASLAAKSAAAALLDASVDATDVTRPDRVLV